MIEEVIYNVAGIVSVITIAVITIKMWFENREMRKIISTHKKKVISIEIAHARQQLTEYANRVQNPNEVDYRGVLDEIHRNQGKIVD